MIRYLRRERPVSLLSTLEHANVLAVGAGAFARTGVPIVLREANVLLPRAELGRQARLLRGLMRHAYRAADRIVAVSRSVATSLTEELGLEAGRIRTIPNPIVTAALYEKATAPLDDPWFASGAPPVVLGVGRLAPQKDFPTLIRAFAQVRAGREARLVILGEGPERRALEALTRQLGVAADVKLPGFDHNPFRYMSRASVFALSSIYEGLPGALIQAMACGCRVISTDGPGGAREVLENGENGPLVPRRDPGALARGISALLDDARSGRRASTIPSTASPRRPPSTPISTSSAPSARPDNRFDQVVRGSCIKGGRAPQGQKSGNRSLAVSPAPSNL